MLGEYASKGFRLASDNAIIRIDSISPMLMPDLIVHT
jgi:hypothetical protein